MEILTVMPRNEQLPQPNKRERTMRFLRNANALGAVALFGLAAIAPPLAAGALNTLGALNVVQAGGFEAARRHYTKRRKKRSS